MVMMPLRIYSLTGVCRMSQWSSWFSEHWTDLVNCASSTFLDVAWFWQRLRKSAAKSWSQSVHDRSTKTIIFTYKHIKGKMMSRVQTDKIVLLSVSSISQHINWSTIQSFICPKCTKSKAELKYGIGPIRLIERYSLVAPTRC